MTKTEIEDARSLLKSLLHTCADMGVKLGEPQAIVAMVRSSIEPNVDALCDLALKGLALPEERSAWERVDAKLIPDNAWVFYVGPNGIVVYGKPQGLQDGHTPCWRFTLPRLPKPNPYDGKEWPEEVSEPQSIQDAPHNAKG